jgi:hypothetical protein
MTHLHLSPSKVLSPDDLRLAADAFDQALQALPAEAHDLKPYTARQLLARYVIDRALSGVRDPVRMRDGALAYIGLAAQDGASHDTFDEDDLKSHERP